VAAVLLVVRLTRGPLLEIAWSGGGFQVRSRLAQSVALLTATGLQAALVCLLIWAAFGFRFLACRAGESSVDTTALTECWQQPGAVADLVRRARDYRLLPEGYLSGFAKIWLMTSERSAFFNGEFGTRGWFWYFPYCLLVKTPLPLFGLGVLAAASAGRRWREAGSLGPMLYQAAPLVTFLAIYWTFALASHVDIGERYLLPTYPVLFILTGAVATWLRPPCRVPLVLTAALVLAYVVESTITWPNYLSYFNAVAGGPRNGYRHLVDSSLDWGQDLPALRRWQIEHGLQKQAAVPVYFSYFGTASPEQYGVQARPLPSYPELRPHRFGPLTGGTYCISATMLQGVYLSHCPGPWTPEYESLYQTGAAIVERLATTNNNPPARAYLLQKTGIQDIGKFLSAFEEFRFARLCAFLRRREPDDQVGYSILIYRLTDREVEQALSPGSPAPLVTAPRRVTSRGVWPAVPAARDDRPGFMRWRSQGASQ
jgi:hypothetical protein